jgi:hypothetical protein
MKIRLGLMAAVLGALAGCAPQDFDEAPTASAFVTELLPKAKREQVDAVAVCFIDEYRSGGDWYATVELEDGGVYHYNLRVFQAERAAQESEGPAHSNSKPDEPVGLAYFNTRAWRTERYGDGHGYKGCFDKNAAYRLSAGQRVKAYISNSIIIGSTFNDAVKLRLRRTAQAVELAAAAHKAHVPVETTWGLKPKI